MTLCHMNHAEVLCKSRAHMRLLVKFISNHLLSCMVIKVF